MVGSPQNQSPEQPRPRSRMLSFRSRSSSGSGSFTRAEMSDFAKKEKAGRRITTKADPTLAMNEAQPAAQALAHTTILPLRSIEHRDSAGEVITDPDRSNPTRRRFESPLETIRSFEAAIDNSYKRRASQMDSPEPQSRRSSWMPNATTPAFQPRMRGEGGVGGQPGYRQPRPESFVDPRSRPIESPYYRRPRPNPGVPGPSRRPVRNHSDPMLYGGNALSPPQASFAVGPPAGAYDSATTESGSGGSASQEPWANSTGPSSENSSVNAVSAAPAAAKPGSGLPPPPPPHHRHHQQGPPPQHQNQHQHQHHPPRQQPQPDLAEVYGIGNFGAGPQLATGAMGPPPPPAHRQPLSPGRQAAAPAPSTGANGAPVPPPKLRKTPTATVAPVEGEGKRRSWLKRAFSKKS